MVRKKVTDSFGILAVFIAAAYIIASWWCYSFDCGFSHRGFVDYYALFAIPFAYTLSLLFRIRSIVAKFIFMALFVFLSYANIRMSMMYSWDPCWNGPNWTYKNYVHVVKKAAIGGSYQQNFHQINE
jgi:hypothetical protein